MTEPISQPSAPEPFSWAKFFSGFTSLTSWAKDIKTIAVLVILLFVGVTIWRAYFMPTQNQNQHQTINVQRGAVASGGTLNLSTPQSQTQTAKPKHWSTGPFIGVLGDKNNHGVFAGWVLLYNF